MNDVSITRRALSVGLLLVGFSRSTANAATYPNRPIRVIVPFSPAGVVDTVTRIVMSRLGPEINGTIVIENKPGAAGFIGTEFVAKSPADGYTLITMSSTTHALSPQLFEGDSFDPIKDFTPIAQISHAPTILVVPSTLPVKSVGDLVALAKKEPNSLNYASYGRGSIAHLAAEQFQLEAGIQITHIPYKGAAPVVSDMVGGSAKIDLFFDSLPSSLQFVKDGRLKALAVTGKTRIPELPDVPSLSEFYPEYEMLVWQGIGAPANLPAEMISKIHAGLVNVMSLPDIRKRFQDLGAVPVCTSPKEFSVFVAAENERWAVLLKRMGIDRQQR